jgi:hypothetical protein
MAAKGCGVRQLQREAGARAGGAFHEPTSRSSVVGAALALTGVAACGEDEDGDGGTTDEEIQEGEDRVDDIGDEVQDEVDAQDQGSNEDGE